MKRASILGVLVGITLTVLANIVGGDTPPPPQQPKKVTVIDAGSDPCMHTNVGGGCTD